MLRNSYKKFGLISVMVCLLGAFCLIPPVVGLGGLTIGMATTVTPGTYPNEYIPAGEVNAYYNVSGRVGENLTVLVTYASQIGAALILPNGTIIAAELISPGVLVLTVICDSNEAYTIQVFDIGGMIKGLESTTVKAGVDLPFTLTIWLSGGDGGIPGFHLFTAFFGCLILLGIGLSSRRRKLSIMK
jgi:hypothetical protein